MLDQLLIDVAKQVPSLVVLGVIVKWFLRHMAETRDKAIDHETRRDDALNTTLKAMSADCHQVQHDATNIMRETKEELGASRQVHTEVLAFMRSKNDNGNNPRRLAGG